MNDLLINSDGQYYVNSNMKFISISILLKRRFIQLSTSLQQQLQKCQTNKCISKIQKKFSLFEQKKKTIDNKFNQIKDKLDYENLLCNDMIYENDIRICRKLTKQKWLKEITYFLNQVNLPKLIQDLNLPN